jgi:hypothetical protein
MRPVRVVVRTLRALRVAGQAVARTQVREVLAAGEQLVHVRLVPGVEDHRVVGRIEYAVQRDRQLDDPEVGAQVTACACDVLDEEAADLVRELLELIDAQRVEVAGSGDGRQQRHPRSFPAREGLCKSTRGMKEGPDAAASGPP